MTTTPALRQPPSNSIAVPSGKEWHKRLGTALATIEGMDEPEGF